MPILLKSSIKKTYAEALLNDITTNRNQYFLFVAKSTPWDATATAAADIVPVVPANTDADEYDTMRGILGYKQLDPSKIIFALPRISWTKGTVYDAYQDDQDLFDVDNPKMFYVVTSANNIYKCLGKATEIPSVVEPSHTTSTAIKGSDGYTWKYLATVKESLLPYELVDYLPVSFAEVQQDTLGTDNETTLQFNAQKSAVDGELTRLELTYAGGISSGGASAAVYLGSEYGAKFAIGASGSTASNASFGVGNLYQITASTNANKFSLPVSDIANYVGCVLRINEVSGSGSNPSDVNRYGIIHGVTASTNQYTFSVRGEYEPFSISYSNSSQKYYFDILPYAKISGDGSGAYGFVTAGKTQSADWRRINGIELIYGGREYSQVKAEIVTAKSDGTSGNTIHPTIKADLSPKGGHASNILKELNVKDIIMVVQLDVNDEDIIPVGGSYRKFGIIKNPALNDNSGRIAGTESVYYRNLILLYLGNSTLTKNLAETNFFSGTKNFITGAESYASFPVSSVTSVSTSNGETRVQLKVLNSQAEPITWSDRLINYELSLSPAKSGFIVGETVTQSIPAGVSIGALGGISYGFGITAQGTIVSATSTKLGVRVTSNAFVSGSGRQVLGSYSGITAAVSGVSLAYGELAWVNKGLSLATEGGLTAELFKFISASAPYFDEASVPSYTGLTVLTMVQPTAPLADFTDTTWKNGDFIQQGISGSYQYDYASASVYKWVKTSVSNGLLYVSEPFGTFKTSSVYGVTFAALNNGLVGGQNAGYVVSGVSAPSIDIHSGEIIYINSIQPIQKLSSQTEEFRLRVGF